MSFIYDLIFLFYAVVYLPYLLLTRRWYQGYAVRFGFFPQQIQERLKGRENIWLHAVSVGEVGLIEGLIGPLKQKYPRCQMVVTATTKTGHALAVQRLGTKAIVMPSPLDFSFVTRSFVGLIDPKLYIVVETEIWPNLYDQLHRRKIPVAIVNGRVSDASFGRYKMVRAWLKPVLNQVSVFCMQSQMHAERVKALGADRGRVKVSGNLKFDAPADTPLEGGALAEGFLWWVAGSTHPGEEEIVVDIYAKLFRIYPQWRLVLAPRHVERVPEIMSMVKRKGHKAVKFSELSATVDGGNAVIVVDAIGPLRCLYARATLVFVGKSLCVGGGHNIIEPARYAKAIVIGPQMANFQDIADCFNQAGAIVQAKDAEDFEQAVLGLAADEHRRRQLGEAALSVIAANQGAVQRTLECLEGFLK